MTSNHNRSTFAGRLRLSPRAIQIALGLLWILDASLQFQPRMFGNGLVTEMLQPAAQGQPWIIGQSINHMAGFLLPHVSAWNALFATTQLLIGAGLLFRRTVRPALVASFGWVLMVWFFGEGLGMLLTGTASPFTGAPGAVLLYGVVGALVWPSTRRLEPGAEQGGIASSVASRGPLGVSGALAAWVVLWVGSAALWVLPANRAADSVTRALQGAASGGQPGWYAHLLNDAAHFLGGSGTEVALLLAAVSVVIGLGPLLTSRAGPFLAAGIAISLAFWITGEGLGGVFTGMGTDPSAGPLFALLGFSLLPTVATSPEASRPPVRALLARSPGVAGALASGLAVALVAGASSAAAAPLSAGMQMASHPSQGGAMAAMPGMGRKTDTSWHYSGPSLSPGETALLTSVYEATERGHKMQTPSCATAPTTQQYLNAMRLVQSTSAAVAKYKSLSAAVADGYVPITSPSYMVVHYIKLAYLNEGDVLDPNTVQSLVYAFTPYGPVLAAAMYLMPAVGQPGPMPGGCLTQWHEHTNLCWSDTTHRIVGFTPCPAGTYHALTPEMFHVWQVPVPGGPLTMDPTDLQVVQAAIEAQQQGLAPVATLQGPPPASPSRSPEESLTSLHTG